MIKHALPLGGGLAAVAAGAVLVAGCGGSGTSYGGGQASAATPATGAAMAMTASARGAQVVRIMAASGGQMRFTTSRVRVARPGRITIMMMNPSNSGLSHGIAVQGKGINMKGPIVAPGKTATLTVTLKKGTYTYYCPVPGHRQAGMHGTLTVA